MADGVSKPPPADYLFVFTRQGDQASSRHLLRHAVVLGKTGYRVTLFLLADATWVKGLDGQPLNLRTCVLTDRCPPDTLPRGVLAETSTEDDLVALMLEPGVTTYWC